MNAQQSTDREPSWARSSHELDTRPPNSFRPPMHPGALRAQDGSRSVPLSNSRVNPRPIQFLAALCAVCFPLLAAEEKPVVFIPAKPDPLIGDWDAKGGRYV